MAKKRTPVSKKSIPQASLVSDELYLPNHSGDHTAGTTAAPINNLDLANKAYVDSLAGSKIHAGTISAYGGATAPTDWLLCNGSAVSRTTYAVLFSAIGTTFGVGNGSTTFNLPDMRGIFPRGAGVNGTLNNANGAAFTGTLGTYQNDKFQGHRFYNGVAVRYSPRCMVYGTTTAGMPGAASHGLADGNWSSIRPYQGHTSTSPISDGTNGTPRTGAETNPANLGLTYIIKYTAANDVGNTILGESGSNVFLNDSTQNVGIGTTTPLHKLHVYGDIKANNDFLLQSGWSLRWSSDVWISAATGSDLIRLQTAGGYLKLENGNVGINSIPNESLTLGTDGVLSIDERATAPGNTAAHGKIWVKNTTPCELWFTDDAGNSTKII